METNPTCNFCGSIEFGEYNGWPARRCVTCNSLGRHRAVKEVLLDIGALDPAVLGRDRALHLAPEESLSAELSRAYGSEYYAMDKEPKNFPHVQCMKLEVSQLQIFPDQHFNLILHNHVLEHLPGSYKTHITEFVRLLRPGGVMVFTVPLYRNLPSVEFGELNDANTRTDLFGQSDHVKILGSDFIAFFDSLPGRFEQVDLPEERAARVKVHKSLNPVFVYRACI